MHTAAISIARWLRAGVGRLALTGDYVVVSIVFVFNLLAAPARAPRCSAYGSQPLLGHQRQWTPSSLTIHPHQDMEAR